MHEPFTLTARVCRSPSRSRRLADAPLFFEWWGGRDCSRPPHHFLCRHDDMGVGPANRPGPHPFVQGRFPSASQRRVGGQNADNLLAYAFRRDQVRTKSMPENAQGERPYCHLRFFFAFVFPFLGCPSSFGATDTKPAALGEVSESTNLNKRSKISPKVKEPNRAAQNSAELSLD